MGKALSQLRPVYVVGIGWHRYQDMSDTSYVTLGLKAVRDALADARLEWPAIESSYVGTALLGMACGRPMLRHLGALGAPIVHIENASASSSAAFRHACIEVGAGMADVALAMGVDKAGPLFSGEKQTGIAQLAAHEVVPATHFALLTDAYMRRHGTSREDIARVALKNHANGARNANAQRQKLRTLEEILGGRPVSGSLTTLQCCPVGEGAAAVVVASEDGIRRLGLDAARAVRVIASATRTEQVYAAGVGFDEELTRQTTAQALAEAGVAPDALDVVELHDAFTVEELHYVEAMGICPVGQAAARLREGAFHVGSDVAVNPSGGLIAMGHPIGPTGVGQIAEVVSQLRGEAGARQQPNARIGLAHMVGLGAVCYVHVLAI
jgi:acetyl-CoA acetyltransferase